MSRVRALAGTRKGAFVLTSDGKREDCRPLLSTCSTLPSCRQERHQELLRA